MRIQSTRVWLNEQFVPAQLVFDNGKITAIETYNAQKADVDYGDKRILPGLIDILPWLQWSGLQLCDPRRTNQLD